MDRGRFQGGMSKVLQNFEGVAQKKKGGTSGWQKGVRSIFQGGADTLDDTMMDFRKVNYENAKKNPIHFTTNIYLYGSEIF